MVGGKGGEGEHDDKTASDRYIVDELVIQMKRGKKGQTEVYDR